MNELSIEEKARAYDNLLERLKDLKFAYRFSPLSDTIEEKFPELAESEDDRIRKEIIAFLTYYHTGQGNSVKYDDDWIVWLEKQGKQILTNTTKTCKDEQNPAETVKWSPQEESCICQLESLIKEQWRQAEKVHNSVNIKKMSELMFFLKTLNPSKKPQGKSALEAAKEEKVDNQNCVKPTGKIEPKFNVGDIIKHKEQGFTCKIIAVDTEYRLSGCNGNHLPFDWQDAYEIIEKKPTNNAEPKFKVGDWIIFNGLTLYVKEVVNGFYRTISKGGITNSYDWDIDNVARLWTIQDAKDGDVLATDSWLYMFKYTNNKDLIQFHCKHSICPINGKTYKWFFLSDDSYLDIYIDANIHPATKEQSDFLFQKMKESGYEWDSDKKELKKIDKEKLTKFELAVKNVMEEAIEDGDTHNLKADAENLFRIAQPTWSKEDDKYLKLAIENFQTLGNSFLTAWLTSLKGRCIRI